MKKNVFPLHMARPGEYVVLVDINGGRGAQRRLLDMGLQRGMKFKVLYSHRPGPCVIVVKNTRLLLGHGIAQKVLVEKV